MRIVENILFSLGWEPTVTVQKTAKVGNSGVTISHCYSKNGGSYVKWSGRDEGLFNGDAQKMENMTQAYAQMIYGKDVKWNGEDIIHPEKKEEEKIQPKKYDQEFVDSIYKERNLLMMLTATLAEKQGLEVGIRKSEEADTEEWPVLYVELPTGEIANHIPRKELIKNRFKVRARPYEPYTTDEKNERIRSYILKY